MKRLVGILIALIILGGGTLWWAMTARETAIPSASLIPLLSEEKTAGFVQATIPGKVTFPRDLGAHEEYQTEWWYYTGNLETSDGRPFGFQLTFFRRSLAPVEQEDSTWLKSEGSAWRTDQVYMAHFTISDISAGVFYENERFSRGAAGLAGAEVSPYHIWLEDWFAEESEPGVIHLFARTDSLDSGVILDLILEETLPPILHGDEGLSVKGSEPGNASYYYSIVHQQVKGQLTIEGVRYTVTGLAWKDHEYSTSALSPGSVGWDWYSLQLDDGSALMFFQIRRQDGTLEPASSGTYILPDGSTVPIALDDWQHQVTETWTSPTSGAVYPSGWSINIPRLGLTLEGRPLMSDQELNVSTIYWEGAVLFEGTRDGYPVTAKGYIELTGYAESMGGRL
jgi:predicted secreted hydrolase